MKKIIIAAIFYTLFVFIPNESYCTTEYDWHVIKDGGETHGIWPFNWVGFKRVESNPTKKELFCEGQGINECVIQGAEYGCLGSHTNDMIDYAVKQHMDGVLSGSFNENIYCEDEDEYYYCTVSWSTNSGTGVCNIYTTNTVVQ